MWMKHIQGRQLLKQTNGQTLVDSHSLSPKLPHCPLLCPLLHVYSEAPQQEPPALLLALLLTTPLSHTAPVQGLSQTPGLNSRCGHGREHWGAAPPADPEQAQGTAKEGGGEERQCQLLLGVFTAHMAQTCTLGCHALLSPLLPQPAPCFCIPGLALAPGSLSLLCPAPKVPFALGEMDASEAVGTQQLGPSTQKGVQGRL